ncbi:MAG: hypothetical protein OEY97_13485 [Nitrospirota bacterium]|nr:hypothetical protein [Nitrospirota bacterium]
MQDIRKQMETLINALPAVIEMPVEDDFEEAEFRTLFGPNGATVAELQVAVDALRARLSEELLRCDALTYLLIRVTLAGGAGGDRVSEVIARGRTDA